MAEESVAREHLDRKRNGSTLLINAIWTGAYSSFHLVQVFSASVQIANSNNVSPIQHAIAGTSVRIVKLLLCFGANFDLDTSLKCGHNQIRDLVTRLRKRKKTGLEHFSSRTMNELKSGVKHKETEKRLDMCASAGRIVVADRMLCHLQNAPYFRLTPQLEVDVPHDKLTIVQ
uniref:ANK_REP_REGION domain-containing protein n=1 Tax=Globodera pallida TaxID=36090 RepID=A0A183C192_GLOPA